MTAHTTPVNTDNQTPEAGIRILSRWAFVTIGLIATSVALGAIVIGAANNIGNNSISSEQPASVRVVPTFEAELSTYVPGADDARFEVGRPDGWFQPATVSPLPASNPEVSCDTNPYC